MTDSGAKEEDVALRRREKDKRNKKTENGLGLKNAHTEKTTTMEGEEDNGVMLKKSSKKQVEKDNISMQVDEANEGPTEGISVVSGHEQRKKKKEKKERKFKYAEEGKDEESKGSEYCETECLSITKEQEESDKRKKKKEKKDRKLKDKEMEDKISKKSEHREREGTNDNRLEKSEKRKKKKVKKDKKGSSCIELPETESTNVVNQDNEENIDYGTYGKSKRKKKKNDNEGDCIESLIEESAAKGKSLPDPKEVKHNDGRLSSSKKKRDREEDVETEVRNKKKKKKLVEDFGFEKPKTGITESRTDHFKDSEPKQSSKRVKFSGNVEVFPLRDVRDATEESQENNLFAGKRFTQKEDKLIKDAVANYIEERGLGENGVEMILKPMKHPEVRNCWREIAAAAVPWRSYKSVVNRGKLLLERGKLRGFTEEEKELIKKFVKERGPKWKELAKILGKHSIHVSDAWRRMQCTKTGSWSQEELQTLFDLVNMDLQMKAFEVKKSDRPKGMLRDNISWTAISAKLGTRTISECCRKWYSQLASPMIKTREWSDADDYKLVNELLMLDACCVEDVDWDNLLENRSGAVCRQRWRQMVNHIGCNGLKSFPEQVEVLAKRYRPEILETRKTLDSMSVE